MNGPSTLRESARKVARWLRGSRFRGYDDDELTLLIERVTRSASYVSAFHAVVGGTVGALAGLVALGIWTNNVLIGAAIGAFVLGYAGYTVGRERANAARITAQIAWRMILVNRELRARMPRRKADRHAKATNPGSDSSDEVGHGEQT